MADAPLTIPQAVSPAMRERVIGERPVWRSTPLEGEET